MRLTALPRVAFLCFATLCAAAFLPAQDTRLSNVSVRTSAGGGDTLITGFTIGPGPAKQVLIRAVGPTLGVFGVPGTLADPKLELYNSASVKIAENDNFNTADAPVFAAVGAFPLGAGAKDASLVTTLAPGSYTAQISGVGSASGVALVEVYEVTGGATRLINLSTRARVGLGGDILIPGITVAPGGGTRRLLLRAVGPTLATFGVPGTLADPKLELYSGAIKIAENDNWSTPTTSSAADAPTLTAAFAANGAFALSPGSKDAALLVNLSAGSYTLQVSGVAATTGTALVEIYDLTPANQSSAGTLYVASLRPEASATGSLASGYATLLIADDGTAQVTVTFSNLSAAQTGAHLKIGSDFVFNLPLGQVVGRPWVFSPVGTYSTAALLSALNSGSLAVGLDSAKYPGGELRGAFVAASGSQSFIAPPAPPALAAGTLTSPTQTDAARFLTQATFGPTAATISALMARGIPGWLDDQMALPMTSSLAILRADLAAIPNGFDPAPNAVQRFAAQPNWQAAWWKTVLTGSDQLRQRVAFALGELLVAGDAGCDGNFYFEMKATYHDLLARHAFGNYRQLLEDVSLNPSMGLWLTYLWNQKSDPVKGTAADENYAREIQQLFTIGLVQLQPDGTLLLDGTGQPIPTYNQTTISETAKVFTGWSYASYPETLTDLGAFLGRPPANGTNPLPDSSGYLQPMRNYPAFHDRTEKRVVSLDQVPLAQARPTIIPANQTGAQDLKMMLDTLFAHPNTGPFVSRHLIQRLVTANPSPAYVYRVAQVFANDGTGTRGNLGAVVRTILTDYEARSPAVLANPGYGKIKEPLLRYSAFLRALSFAAPNGQFLNGFFGNPNGYSPNSSLFVPSQSPLGSKSVFNFFSPTYAPPGAMAAAGLVSPELQIVDSENAIQVPNAISVLLFRDVATLPQPAAGASPYVVADFTPFLANARNPAALLDQLNLIFCANQMTANTRTQITAALQSLNTETDLVRVQTALQLVVLCPDGATQR